MKNKRKTSISDCAEPEDSDAGDRNSEKSLVNRNMKNQSSNSHSDDDSSASFHGSSSNDELGSHTRALNDQLTSHYNEVCCHLCLVEI